MSDQVAAHSVLELLLGSLGLRALFRGCLARLYVDVRSHQRHRKLRHFRTNDFLEPLDLDIVALGDDAIGEPDAGSATPLLANLETTGRSSRSVNSRTGGLVLNRPSQ